MIIKMWLLVLLLHPHNFNEWARTPENMGLLLTAYHQEWECESAREALQREAKVQYKPNLYVCFHDDYFMHPSSPEYEKSKP